MEDYTRQQLHDLVWSGPMRDVSKKLGMSDNGLRKHCIKGFVPLPPQGHWNKLKAGHKVKVTPLPPRPPGVSDKISIGKWDYRAHERRLKEVEPVAPAFDEDIDALRTRVARNLGVVIASKNLSPPHAAFRRQIEDDARKAAQYGWHTPIFNSPLEKRRLRILQGLFYGLSRLDCWATVQGPETRTISIGVGHQQIPITLERVIQRRRSASEENDADRLKFGILRGFGDNAERLSWVDTEEQLIEAQLSAIAAEIVVAGEMQYREHIVWVHEETIRRREEMRLNDIRIKLEAEKAERERLIRVEADRLKRLTDSAENFQRAQAIRAFVSTVMAIPAQNIEAERISDWRVWALLQADKLDPITTGRIWDDVSDRA